MSYFVDFYNKWRKSSLFPSVNDIDWRHKELVARLMQIREFQIKDDMPISAATIETQKNVLDFLAYLQPMKVVGANKIRVGGAGDGGYVQLDDLLGINLALSFGIKDHDAWDFEIASRDIPVQQFDYTIDKAPSTHPNLSFYKKKITGNSCEGCITLKEIITSHKAVDHPDILLKIDIEGSEWEVFDHCPDEHLSRIGQILCEFHGLSRLNNSGFYNLARRVVEKLHKHFIPYHVHGNNAGQIISIANVTFPDVLEVSFANRKKFKAIESDEIFPTDLDYANIPEIPDIFLGKFQFKS